MKNLFLVPTEKTSKLWLSTKKENYLIFDRFLRTGVEYVKPQHIYITSNEEVKDGEYGICLNLVKEGYKAEQAVFKMDAEQRDSMEFLGGQEEAQVFKVILTTDTDLITDGVQAIDDEFLEWFVKNPSCVWANVNDWLDDNGNIAFGEGKRYQICNHLYDKLTIPKEEPNQDLEKEMFEVIKTEEDAKIFVETMENIPKPNDKLKKAFKKQEITFEEVFGEEKKKGLKEVLDKHKSKLSNTIARNELGIPAGTITMIVGIPRQETLEEAKQRILDSNYVTKNDAEIFEMGVKWQQEQSKNLYTQEEVKQMLIECCSEVSCEDGTLVGKTPVELYKWIEEKFKKN